MPDWRQLIDKAERPQIIEAISMVRKLKGMSNPSLWKCEDGERYVVKMPEQAAIRTSVNDQIAGCLGKALGAPVADACLVLVRTNVYHGSQWIDGCEYSEVIDDFGIPENRSRFALLAILYAWIQIGDRQFLYRKHPPKLVFSHDHGVCFPRDLENPQTCFRVNARIRRDLNLQPEEIKKAKAALRAVSDDVIASAVVAPRDEWGVTLEYRVAMASYLARARDEILLS
jgi:hypothetical protein